MKISMKCSMSSENILQDSFISGRKFGCSKSKISKCYGLKAYVIQNGGATRNLGDHLMPPF